MVAQKYVDNMLGKMLEQCIQHVLSELDIVDVQARQVVDTSLISQRYEDWIDSANDICLSVEISPSFWVNKKQNCAHLCYDCIAKGSSCPYLIWIKSTSQEYNVKLDVMILYYQNLGVVIISEKLSLTNKSQHFDTRHHSIRELTEEKIVIRACNRHILFPPFSGARYFREILRSFP